MQPIQGAVAAPPPQRKFSAPAAPAPALGPAVQAAVQEAKPSSARFDVLPTSMGMQPPLFDNADLEAKVAQLEQTISDLQSKKYNVEGMLKWVIIGVIVLFLVHTVANLVIKLRAPVAPAPTIPTAFRPMPM